MKASETMLERRLAEGRDVATVLEMKAAENHLLNSKDSEMTTATDSLAAHIKVVRTASAKVDALADGADPGRSSRTSRRSNLAQKPTWTAANC